MPLNPVSQRLQAVDSLTIDVITDDVSDAYVTKTLFAVSEFANIVKGGAKGGGIHRHRFLEGTFVGGCIFLGRVAGRHAARQV